MESTYHDGFYAEPQTVIQDEDGYVRGPDWDVLATKGLHNANRIKVEGEGTEIEPLPMGEIIASLLKQTGDWPRCVGEVPFVHDSEHGIGYLLKQAALFGWAHRELGTVQWSQATGCVTKEEFFAELKRTATKYRAVETLPHFPPRENTYYAHEPVKPGDGETLRTLLSRFNPATPIDGDLIQALFVSAFWGGPGGMRPCFVITADDGRGSGKTALLRALGHLVGGAFEIGVADSIEAIKKRLLTPSTFSKRLVLGDNIKANRYSNGDLEGIVTAAEISGHQMYVGEATRPNTLLYSFTLNGPSFSRDMSQRSINIKVAKPVYDPLWWEKTAEFIDQNRATLLGDIAAFFDLPAVKLDKCSRWGAWEKDVLARLPEPSDAQRVIAERQEAIDGDTEECNVIEDYFGQQLAKYGYGEEDSVHIPSKVAATWMSEAMNERVSTTAMSRTIGQYAKEGDLKYLSINPSRAHGRGLLWYAGGDTRHDLTTRIEEERNRERRGY
jgi:hypothetical protein